MKELTEVGVLTEEEIENVIAVKFNPVKLLFQQVNVFDAQNP